MQEELKKCPICGSTLKIHGPDDWTPTFYDPDSGGEPYSATCECGFQFSSGSYDYEEFVEALNLRTPDVVNCADCAYKSTEGCADDTILCKKLQHFYGVGHACNDGKRRESEGKNELQHLC